MLVSIKPKKQQADSAANGKHRIIRNLDANGHGEIIVEDMNEVRLTPRIPQVGDFDENLAEKMDRNSRMQLARKIIEYISVDETSRKDWLDREKKGLEMLGLKDMPEESPNAPGVHKVTHPLLAEALVQFQARAITELFPPEGPAKCVLAGESTKDLEDRRDRVQRYVNYYCTQQDKGYFADFDQMLFYLPMGGTAFRKCGQNWATGLPEVRYVKAVDFIANYHGQDLETMPRYTYQFTMGGSDVRRGQEIGMLASDVMLMAPHPGQAENSKTSDLADQRVPSHHEDDENYEMLECTLDLNLEEDEISYTKNKDGEPVADENTPSWRSYVVLVEKNSTEVLAVRRNWVQNDPMFMKRVTWTRYKFLPGMGFYGAGLVHVIGGLQLATSGALNAQLDSAFAANFQGGFKARVGNAKGGETVLEHGRWVDVEMGMEDLAKMFYTPPFKEPSTALSNVMQILVDTGRRFAGTTDVAVGDQSSQNAPVGTTLALIEQANKPQSAIHKRLHDSLKHDLQILTQAIRDFLPERYPYQMNGVPQEIMAEDFADGIDVVPVSDPNIYSSTQRIAICQAVLQLQAQAPDLYSRSKRVAAHKMMLKALRTPDLEDIQPDDDQAPVLQDPITENANLIQGHAAQAFDTQDHAAHIQIHKNGMQYAEGSMDPQQFQQQVYPAFQAHIQEHIAMLYTQQAFTQAKIPRPPQNPDGSPAELTPDIEVMITHAVLNALPAPPMSQQQQAEAQKAQDILSASQAKVQAMQQETGAKISREDKLAQAKAAREDDLARAKVQRETAGFVTKAARDHTAAKLDEQRKDQSSAADMIRKSAAEDVKLHSSALQAKIKVSSAAKHADIKVKAAAKAANKPKPKK